MLDQWLRSEEHLLAGGLECDFQHPYQVAHNLV